MYRSFIRSSALVATVIATAVPALAASPAAVFPFEIVDTSGEAPTPGRDDRLRMASEVLAESLAKSGLYTPVDLNSLTAKVAATSPRYACDRCFLPVAREAGAKVAVVSIAHKVSTLVSSMDIWIFDVDSGAPITHASGQIRGDTDEAYAHGVRFLVRNRIVDLANTPAK
jgi:hypothetical protein